MSKHFSRCGGTGRHKGLKIPRGRLRTGSNPVIGTSWRLALRPQKIRRVFLVCFFTPRYCRAAKVPKTRTVRNKNARRMIWLTRVYSSLFRRKLLTNPVIGYPRRLALLPQKIRRVFLVCFFCVTINHRLSRCVSKGFSYGQKKTSFVTIYAGLPTA